MVLTAAIAVGQSSIKADIPFPFVVTGATLPAGHYEVSLGNQVMSITNSNKQTVFVLTLDAANPSSATSGKLVFHRYDNTYFLAQVLSANGDREELQRTPSEEELENKQTK
jgi:ABC-type uncharacterized transport system substrate-binding protein